MVRRVQKPPPFVMAGHVATVSRSHPVMAFALLRQNRGRPDGLFTGKIIDAVPPPHPQRHAVLNN